MTKTSATESSAHQPEPARSAARSTIATPAVAPTVLRPRSIGVTPCPSCGERVDAQALACPECGERLRQEPRLIRCVHCGAQASSELSVCPSCCRELRAAPSPALAWGMPVGLVLLFVLVLATRWDGSNPLSWARERLDRGVALVETLGNNFEPELVIVMTPVPGSNAGTLAVALAPLATNQQSATANASGETVVDPEPTEAPAAAIRTVADEIAALGVGGAQAAEESAPAGESMQTLAAAAPSVESASAEAASAAVEPMAEAAVTPAPPPATPEPPAAEPTTAPSPVVVELGGLAARTTPQAPTPTWTPLATLAPETTPVAPTATPVAPAETPVQLLAVLPTPTPDLLPRGVASGQIGRVSAGETLVASALPTATPTVTPVAYQVRSGDTLVVIARRYNVTVEELMAVNGIAARDVTRIMPGRTLIVPVPTPTPPPTPTPSPIRLAAPLLLAPEDGAQLDCLREERLQWERVQYIKDSDKYVLHMGFVAGYEADGREQITWVVALHRPVTVTEWTLDPALCSLAPQAYGRQWRWWVEVVADVEGVLAPVSPPSELWGFVWQ